jgi:DNA-binding transcriptional LysR family regulator
MLEVKDLILARTVAEHGSLARAARVLSIGQPALTRSLAGLEARLRGPLFERSRRGMAPTDLCRALLAEAGEILGRLERLDRHLAEVRGAQTQTLSVIAGAYVAETTALVAAARMLEVHPTVRLRLGTANWADIPRAVREREAAIGIADVSDLGEAPDLEVEPLHPMPGLFVVRPGHPLAEPGQTLDLARIMAWPFVFLGRIPRRVQEPLALAREQARRRRRGRPSRAPTSSASTTSARGRTATLRASSSCGATAASTSTRTSSSSETSRPSSGRSLQPSSRATTASRTLITPSCASWSATQATLRLSCAACRARAKMHALSEAQSLPSSGRPSTQRGLMLSA